MLTGEASEFLCEAGNSHFNFMKRAAEEWWDFLQASVRRETQFWNTEYFSSDYTNSSFSGISSAPLVTSQVALDQLERSVEVVGLSILY